MAPSAVQFKLRPGLQLDAGPERSARAEFPFNEPPSASEALGRQWWLESGRYKQHSSKSIRPPSSSRVGSGSGENRLESAYLGPDSFQFAADNLPNLSSWSSNWRPSKWETRRGGRTFQTSERVARNLNWSHLFTGHNLDQRVRASENNSSLRVD